MIAPAKLRAVRFGRRAEWLAAWYMRLKGFRVVARDLRLPGGEIDLVLRRGRLLVLLEIKARAGEAEIEASITDRQWRRIAAAAEQFCARRTGYGELDRRFDALFLARGALAAASARRLAPLRFVRWTFRSGRTRP